MNSAPNIMVSSTFYDLRQVRADLAQFISNDLGYIPLLSELSSFPVDPDLDTIENCRTRVDKNADILVLVVGGRYGSIDLRTDKSITNLEFLTARAKGIPVYTFVEQSIVSMLPVWKDNPRGNFSSCVDTPRVFEFVESIRSQDKVWTFPFAVAQDITNILRVQLAYLFRDALGVRLRIGGGSLPDYLKDSTPKSLRLALEKPVAWEYRFFLQSWIDQTERRKNLIREYRDGLKVRIAETVHANTATDWMQTRLHELQGLVASAGQLINSSAPKGFGLPGEPGDAGEIAWVSEMLGVVFEKSIEWAQRIRCADVESPFDVLASEMALFAHNIIGQLEEFPKECLEKVERASANATGERPQTITMTMHLELSNLDAFNKQLADVQRHFQDKSSQ